MPDLGNPFVNIHIYIYLYIYIYMKYWKLKKNPTIQTKRQKKTLEKESYINSNECGQDWGCSSLPVTFWLFDDVMCTAYCRRVRAIAWLAFFMRRGWIPGCLEHHVPPNNTDTTGHFLFLQCISERTTGAVNAGSIFFFVCGFLLVALQKDLHCTGELHCGAFDKKTTARGRMANYKRSYCVCVQKHLLYFYLEKKIQEQVNGCFAPQRLTPMEAYLLLFWNKFSLTSVFFFFFFLLRNVMFCTCAMQLYRSFREGRSNYYLSSFYLICKPTASALENAMNKVTLGFFSF